MHTGSDGSVDLAAYDRYLGRWSGLFVPALVEAAGIGRGDRVLDVATGPGDAAIAVRSVAADGQQLPFGNDTFDAVICQLGLMFSAAMWGVLARVLSDHLPDQHKAFHLSFSLADPGTMIELFTRAGYRDVQVQRHVRNSVFDWTTTGSRSNAGWAHSRTPTARCRNRSAVVCTTRLTTSSARTRRRSSRHERRGSHRGRTPLAPRHRPISRVRGLRSRAARPCRRP